jgi:hypothetical protein
MRTLAIRVSTRLIATISLIASVALTGCGLGTPAGPAGTTLQSVSGHIHGGQTPIVGALVTLYVAGSTGYGAGATVIGTARSDSYSNFSISPSVTTTNCPAGSQAYITAAGGGANYQPANTAMLEMAALGDCSTLSSSTYTTLNELTTVAAAYALSGFTTTSYDSTNSVYKAIVGAPVANNSAVGSITATAPAGLAHAFLNAANLVNPASGTAKSTFSANTAGTTTVATVPAAELNTLADMMEACVDAGAVPNTSCTTLFGFTPSISGTAPLNTLQAFLYLARNPYPSAAAMNSTTGLLGLVSANSAFQPTLSTAPNDWSISIGYHSALAAPYFVALDANDTAYLGVASTSSSTPAIYGISPYGVTVPAFASQSAGTATRGIAPDALGNIWVANNATAVDRFSASAGTLSGTYTTTIGTNWPVAVDKQNNMWVGHAVATAGVTVEEAAYNSSTSTWAQNYTASTDANTGAYGLAIDGNQNIWDAAYITGSTESILLPNLNTAASPSYASSGTAITPVTATLASSATKGYSFAIDATGNAWEAIYGGASTATTGLEKVIPNAYISATSITPGSLIAGTSAGTNGNVLGTATALEMAIDGAGTLFVPDNSTSGIHMYSTVTGNTLTPSGGLKGPSTSVVAVYLKTAGAGYTSAPTVAISGTGTGAVVTAILGSGATAGTVVGYTVLSGGTGYTGTTTATLTGGGYTTAATATVNTSNTIYNPRQVAIDSTGSVWTGWTSAGTTQIIGVAAPSYPLLSIGKPGLSPGLTAVNPLP